MAYNVYNPSPKVFGALVSPEDSRDFVVIPPCAPAFPESFSLTSISPTTDVKNQANVGSCVAHATSSILEWFNLRETGKFKEASTDFIYGMKDVFNKQLTGKRTNYEGMYLRDACKCVQLIGDVEKQFCPTNTKTVDGAMEKAEAVFDNYEALNSTNSFRVRAYARCYTETQMKTALMGGSPLLFCINWYNSYSFNTDGVLFWKSKAISGSHAMMIYGWDSNGWLVQNSWGLGFGHMGHFKLSFDTEILEAWSFIDETNNIQYTAPARESSGSTDSPLATYTKLSPNYNDRLGNKITKITVHHTAGIGSAETIGDIFASPARQASANYGIGNDGKIGLYVPEQYRAWTSSSWDNDKQAVTIEVSNNTTKDPWTVSAAALNSLIDLLVDICRRNDIKQLVYTGDAKGNFTKHSMFANTNCPGPYLSSMYETIAQTTNSILNGEEDIDMTKAQELEEKIARLEESLGGLETEVGALYNQLDQVPDWAKVTVNKLINKGILKGDEHGLGLSYQQIRLFVILDRQGVFDR